MTEAKLATWRNRVIRAAKYGIILLGVLVAVVGVWAVHIFRFHGVVEKVSFKSGDVTIKGQLVVPEGPGPHPVVVFLHGSGPEPGDGPPVRIMGNAFLRSGIGILAYDKRGVGSSGGTFRHNAYDNFIDDGISAIEYLESRDDVDARALGLLGSSEGGWLAPEIAVRTGSVAFIVNRAGPPLPWIDTNLWELRHDLLNEGISGELLEEAVRLRGLVWRFLVRLAADPVLVESKEGQQIEAEIAEFDRRYGQNEAWLKLGIPRRTSLADYEEYYQARKQAISYDPQPFIEQLNIPMLYVFGEDDRNVPTAQCVEYLQSLQGPPERDIEIIVIPDVDHAMISFAGILAGGYDPAFSSAIGPWAAEKISTK